MNKKIIVPWVPIYYDSPTGEKTLDLFLKANPKGIVVVGAADGFINEVLLLKIVEMNIPIIRTSSIAGIEVKRRQKYDDRYGTIPAGILSPAQAQVLMSLVVAAGMDVRSLLK